MTQHDDHAGGPGGAGAGGDDRGLFAGDAASRLTVLTHDLRSLLDGSMRWLDLAERGLRAGEASGDADASGGVSAGGSIEAAGSARALRQLDTVRGALSRMSDLVTRASGSGALGGGVGIPRVSLAEAAGHAAEVLRPRAAASGIGVGVTCDSAVGRLPAGAMYSVLLNGLTNAVESVEQAITVERREDPVHASGRGRVDVAVRARPIGSAAGAGDGDGAGSAAGLWRAEVEIVDDGIGPPIGGGAERVFRAGFSTRGDEEEGVLSSDELEALGIGDAGDGSDGAPAAKSDAERALRRVREGFGRRGIGLALAKSLVEEAGGGIELVTAGTEPGRPGAREAGRSSTRPGAILRAWWVAGPLMSDADDGGGDHDSGDAA